MKKNLLCAILIIFFNAMLALAEESLLISGHPDYPPVMWKENDKIVGVGADIAEMIFKELDINYEISFTGPWKRVQENARHGKIDLICGLYSNNERRSYMDYTVPYLIDPTSIFTMKEKTFPFNRWEDLIGKKGTTIYGDSFGEKLDQFIQKKLIMHKSYDAVSNLKILEAGRVDYILWGYYPCMISIYTHGYKGKIIPLPNNIVAENMYMAFSKKSKHLHLIPKVNQMIKRFKSQGLIQEKVEYYLKYYKKTVNGK